MRIYSLRWPQFAENSKLKQKTDETFARLRLDLVHLFVRRLCRKKSRLIIALLLFLLAFCYLWRLWAMYRAVYTEDEWVDEDVRSTTCSNARLAGLYAVHGHPAVHRVTRLRTQRYKPGVCVRYHHWKIADGFLMRPPPDIPILFAVHSTPAYFKHLKLQALLNTWDGLISLALVIPYENDGSAMDLFRIQTIMEGLDRLKHHYDYDRVALHLVFETDSAEGECPDLVYNRPSNETLWDRGYADIVAHDFERLCASRRSYPINVARNVARLAVQTPLFVSGDIENVFSLDYERRMRPLAWRLLYAPDRPLRVLVHRRFEVDPREETPRSLAALRLIFSRNRAVEFHRFVFLVGHKIPELGAWLLLHTEEGNGTATVFRTYRYLNEYWEPQYVARNDRTLPLHDESFPFRFRSNTHLGSEMCRAGFVFSVVDELFTVHSGIKRRERQEFVDFLQRSSDSGELKRIAERFTSRLDREYPLTRNACPKQFRDYAWSPNYVDPLKRPPDSVADKFVQ